MSPSAILNKRRSLHPGSLGFTRAQQRCLFWAKFPSESRGGAGGLIPDVGLLTKITGLWSTMAVKGERKGNPTVGAIKVDNPNSIDNLPPLNYQKARDRQQTNQRRPGSD